MAIFIHDANLITEEEVKQILYKFQNSSTKPPIAMGAGSFCNLIEFGGKKYALLRKRSEKLEATQLNSVMNIINDMQDPVPILSAMASEETYVIIMPFIEGHNLPSYVYNYNTNLSLIQKMISKNQQIFDDLARSCAKLVNRAVYIDFHGGNFIYEPKTDKVRIIDLKRRQMICDHNFIRRFLGLSAYDKLSCFKGKSLIIEEDKTKSELNIEKAAAISMLKSYKALTKVGFKENDINKALHCVYQDKDIEDIEKLTF